MIKDTQARCFKDIPVKIDKAVFMRSLLKLITGVSVPESCSLSVNRESHVKARVGWFPWTGA